MPNLSAVIITKNEASNIVRCIESLDGLVTEIIVIDSFSTDKTAKIARDLGATVVQKEWEGYSQNKNYGNQLAENDWIISIDADEVITQELKTAIQELALEKNKVYSINRLNNYCGQWIKHCNWHPDWKIRIFHRKVAAWKGDFVHEKLALAKNIKIVKIEGLLHHYSYQNSADHWQRIERYAQLSAHQLFQKRKKATFVKRWLAPIARFLRTFFLKFGFLDGKAGWTISLRNGYLVYRKYQLLKEMQTKG